ncbi:DUF3304 domain-containing protein [Pseudomonas sp. TH03]|uniref:DUF3304 domain-containing protein n=1 Tax=Pseudomonas sp. TH03 TaxID=2796369 RepID=UPI00191228C6|nr:DUF3304 domain-containing protein [Pseudomonas sp. TH03]MBK5549038.1 DUF3304 domain-containing protein [Pseudomonas sp. TH03]
MSGSLIGLVFPIRSIRHISFLILGLLVLSSCSSNRPKMLSTSVTGYNHTSAAINRFTVNGAVGPNLGPRIGGGSEVCCGMIPRVWTPGLRAIVEWEKDPNSNSSAKWPPLGTDEFRAQLKKHEANYSHHEATVEIPKYDVAGSLKVHFLSCDQVRVSADNIKFGEPGYTYNYPMNMEAPKVCGSL